MSQNNPSPYQYEFRRILIESDRRSTPVDVTASVVEVVLFEHLDRPYLSGKLALLDDANVFAGIDFLGTERIFISIKVPDSTNDIERTFFIREVETAVNTNDQAQILSFSIVDADYYLNSLINLQKKYDGKPTEIIKNILLDNFSGKKLKARTQPEIQAPIRFIVPNMTPMGAMQTISRRATDDLGAPYFLFASLTDNDLRYFSLKEMLDRPAINARTQPYRLNQKIAQDDTLLPAYAAYNITGWEYNNNENMLSLIENGDVGAEYQFHDVNSNMTSSYKHSIDAIYDKLYQITSSVEKAPLYDNITTINSKKLHRHMAKTITSISTARTFETISNIHEDNSAAFHRGKSVSKTLRNILLKSSVDITVPGINFLSSKFHLTTGNTVEIEALKNFIPLGKQGDLVDQKKSGKYLMYAARHQFSVNRYEVTLTCGKISNTAGSTKRGAA